MAEKLKRTKPLVLVVDDDRATCEMLARYLEAAQYSTVLASSGDQAIKEARRLIPDAIVTDVMIPGPGGLEMLFILRNIPETAGIPAVVISGIDPRILGSTPGVPYLLKPVDREEFVAVARDCIESRREKSD